VFIRRPIEHHERFGILEMDSLAAQQLGANQPAIAHLTAQAAENVISLPGHRRQRQRGINRDTADLKRLKSQVGFV
jgi:hypothetical protein